MVIRGDVKLNSSPTSGTGDPLLTRDTSSGIVGEITAIDTSTFIPTTLTSGYILVGNGSNVATGVAVTGDISVNNSGVVAISSGVIIDADVNAAAGITLTKLATITASRALASDASGYITPSAVTSTELGYVSGVTSSIQTQLNSKQATITGGATTIVSSNLTVSRLLVSDGSGKIAVSATTSTEAGYLSGVTSAIQTQLNTKQVDIQFQDEGVNIGAVGAVGIVDFVGAGVTASHSGGTVTVTIPGTANGLPTGGTAGQVLIKDSGTDYNASFQDLVLSDVTDVNATAAEVNILSGATLSTAELNYVDGVTSNIQTQLDTKLLNNLAQNAIWYGNASNQATQLAAGTDGYILTSSGGVPAWEPPTGGGGGHTIQDEGTPLTQRTNLNFVGSAVTVTDGGSGPDSTIVTISGGTITVGDTQVLFADGANNPAGEAAFTYNKTTNTLDVDNVTVDDDAYGVGWNGSLEVPTKNAVYDQVELKSNIASPTFTGTPAAPTASTGTNTTQLATTAFVQTELAGAANISSVGARLYLFNAY